MQSDVHILQEGKAKFYASQDREGKISKDLEVFYNPAMKFNRDVTVLLLNSMHSMKLINNLQIADIMAGSGVRSLRLMLELDSDLIIDSLNVNDISEGFSELFQNNLELNSEALFSNLEKGNMNGNVNNDHVTFNKDKLFVTNDDANLMLVKSKGFDFIDIDPFGSPNDFLDNAITRISRVGILGVTGTDTAPLSGTYPKTCARNYWGIPLNTGVMHEIGLRILIRKIQLLGGQHDRALIPIFAYFKDHYNRIIFKCVKRKTDVDGIIKQHKYFLHCKKCLNHNVSEYNYHKCVDCGTLMDYSGPIWIGQLFDKDIAEEISGNFNSNNSDLDTSNSNNKEDSNKSDSKTSEFKPNPAYDYLELSKFDKRFLKTIVSESKLDFVGFHDIHLLCKHHGIEITNYDKLIEEIISKGYVVSRVHSNPYGLKTDMPLKELVALLK